MYKEQFEKVLSEENKENKMNTTKIYKSKEDPTIKYWAEEQPDGKWFIFSESSRWPKRNEDIDTKTKEDAELIMKEMAHITTEFPKRDVDRARVEFNKQDVDQLSKGAESLIDNVDETIQKGDFSLHITSNTYTGHNEGKVVLCGVISWMGVVLQGLNCGYESRKQIMDRFERYISAVKIKPNTKRDGYYFVTDEHGERHTRLGLDINKYKESQLSKGTEMDKDLEYELIDENRPVRIDEYEIIASQSKYKNKDAFENIKKMVSIGVGSFTELSKTLGKSPQFLYNTASKYVSLKERGELEDFLKKEKLFREKYYKDQIGKAEKNRDRAILNWGKAVLSNPKSVTSDQLSKGTEVELEHKDTIEEIASGKLTTEQAAEKIAEDHISEDKLYYDKLEQVEKKETPLQKAARYSYENIAIDYRESPMYVVGQMLIKNGNDWDGIEKRKGENEHAVNFGEIIGNVIALSYSKRGKTDVYLHLSDFDKLNTYEEGIKNYQEELKSEVELSGQKSIVQPEENLIMTTEQSEEKEVSKSDTNTRTNFGSDDWLKIPESNKFVTKVVSKAFAYDPSDKNFQAIMSEFSGDDSLRPIMSGVNFDENGICATDAHKLGYINHVSKEFKGTYCISNGCKKTIPVKELKDGKIEGKYPNYPAVVPHTTEFVYDVDILALKTYVETVIRSRFVNQVTNTIIATYDNLKVFGFNGKLMIQCCEAFLAMGHRNMRIGLNAPNKAMVFVAEKKYNGTQTPVLYSDFFLLMPVMVVTDKGGVDYEDGKFNYATMQGDFDYEYELNIAFDFVTGKVVTKGGDIYHEIDVKTTKEQARNKAQLNPEYIDLASRFQKKNNSIPILDYVAIRDRKMIVTNLETSFVISDVDLADGLYRVNGNALFIENGKDVEDFPLMPDTNTSIGDISRQELIYHLGRAKEYVGKNEFKPVIAGVHMFKDENGDLVIEATNAHALYRSKIEKHSIDGSFDYIMSDPELCYRILSTFECDDIEFSADEGLKNYKLVCGDGTLYNYRIDGKYPETSRVYPDQTLSDITIKTSDIKSLISEIKSEAKKAGQKTKEVSAAFKFSPESCSYYIGYYEGAYQRDKKYIVLKEGSFPCKKVDVVSDTNRFEPLFMPIMINEDYSTGIGIENLEKIANIGTDSVVMGYIEPQKGLIIKNKPELAGTKKTTKQKEKEVAQVIEPTPIEVVDPIEPVEEVSIPNTETANMSAKKIPVKNITIKWAEGDNKNYDKFPKKYKSYVAANKAIIPVFNDVLKYNDGGYNKVKFIITFADGEEYEGRLDVSEREDNPITTDNVIGKHVKDFLDYQLSEKSKTSEDYKKEIIDWLQKYDLGFGETISKPEESNEEQEIKDTIEGLEILKGLAASKKEKKEIQDTIDGLKILLEMPETFGLGGSIEKQTEILTPELCEV